MSYIFEQLQVYGWTQEKENMLLSTILTGDRALIVSEPGSAKTMLGAKMARALDVAFGKFDLNSVQFEDMVGFPSVKAAAEGRLEFLSVPGTIWGKRFVVLEEISRIKQVVQGKTLEVLREGTINGMPTGADWMWANMNPVGSAGSNKLLPAMIDRFAIFMWAPDALDMTPEDRAQIASVTTQVDAPALRHWLKEANFNEDEIKRFIDTTDYKAAGEKLSRLLKRAIRFYADMSRDMTQMGSFLSIFADALFCQMRDAPADEKRGDPVKLSGRRLTLLYRTILANRAIEEAMDSEFGIYKPSLQPSVQKSLMAGIPWAINEDDAPHDSMKTFVNQALRISFHRLQGKDNAQAELEYRLFCSRDPLERAQILLAKKFDPNVLSAGWQKMVSMNERGADLTAFMAIQLDARRRAAKKDPLLPDAVLEILKKKIKDKHVMPELPKMPGQVIPHLHELNETISSLTKEDPVLGLVAIETTHKFTVENPHQSWDFLQKAVRTAVEDYRGLMASAEA